MGMGMIGRALAAGVGGGLEATGNMMGRQIINQMDEEKARRIAEFNSQMRREDDAYNWKNEQERSPIRAEMKRGEAVKDAESAMGVTESLAPRASKLETDKKTGLLQWDVANAPTVNKLAADKARATESPGGARLRQIQTEMAELSLTRAKEEQKIPAAVGKAYDAAKANYHDALTISSKNDFDPNSETGKRVLADMESSSRAMRDLMKPYLPQKEGKTPTRSLDEIAAPPKAADSSTEKPSAATDAVAPSSTTAPQEPTKRLARGNSRSAVKEYEYLVLGTTRGSGGRWVSEAEAKRLGII